MQLSCMYPCESLQLASLFDDKAFLSVLASTCLPAGSASLYVCPCGCLGLQQCPFNAVGTPRSLCKNGRTDAHMPVCSIPVCFCLCLCQCLSLGCPLAVAGTPRSLYSGANGRTDQQLSICPPVCPCVYVFVFHSVILRCRHTQELVQWVLAKHMSCPSGHWPSYLPVCLCVCLPHCQVGDAGTPKSLCSGRNGRTDQQLCVCLSVCVGLCLCLSVTTSFHVAGTPRSLCSGGNGRTDEQLFPLPRGPSFGNSAKDVCFTMIEGDFQVLYSTLLHHQLCICPFHN